MTAEELLRKAALCQTCGEGHKYRWVAEFRASWAADDGHAYRPVASVTTLAMLRYLATGVYADPYGLPPKPALAG